MTIKHRAGGPAKFMRVASRLLSVLLLSAAPLALADDAGSGPTRVEFRIPVQTVPVALSEFARQARVQLFFIFDGYESVRANAVVGTYTRQQALDLLLAGTGLKASLSPDFGIEIKPVSSTVSLPNGESRFFAAAGEVAAPDGAGASGGVQQQAGLRGESDKGEDVADPFPLEEVVVTGSQIRGVPPVGANVITLDRTYIELNGLATTQEVLQSLPQNFGEGATEANINVGLGDFDANAGYASSINLRGLGSASTLLLLNGRRSAAGGANGSFVDLNSIPAAAIERIEVLPDGASALYGSDAVSGVVNVILRENYQGAETSVRYAPDINDTDEFQFSHVFGRSWASGKLLFTYEYYDRSELKAADRLYTRDSDLTPLGGTDHSFPGSVPGNFIDPVTFQPAFAIPDGQDGTALTSADLIDLSLNPEAINLTNWRAGTSVLPQQRRHSAYITLSQELSDTLDLFAETRYSSRHYDNRFASSESLLFVPSTNAFFVEPFGLPFAIVDYHFGPARSQGHVDTLSAALGATFELGNSWEVEAYGAYNSEETADRIDEVPNTPLLNSALADSDPDTAFNPFGDGSYVNNQAILASIAGFRSSQYDSRLAVLNIRADGNLFEMPGGAAKLAIGAQFRDDMLKRNRINFLSTPEPVADSADYDLERNITSMFAEIYLPLVSDQNSRPGIERLLLSFAGRYEDYSDFGETIEPKFGISWSPSDSITFRSTVGSSFRAPLLKELDDSDRRIFRLSRPDPDFENLTTALVIFGNNSALQPEEGATWTSGFDVEPASLPGFHLGMTYFSVQVDGRISLPGPNSSVVLQEPVTFAPVITRCPCDAEAIALMNDPDFASTPVPPGEIGAIIDFRLSNTAKVEFSGLDLDGSYAFETPVGSFDVSLYASYLFEFREQLANGPLVDNIDTITKPTSLKLRSGLSWHRGGVSASVFGNHVSDYTDTFNSAGDAPVSSWTTWDLQLGYDFGERVSGTMDGFKALLNVRNLFDRDPPFVDGSNGVGFDAINANALGRFVAVRLTKEW